MVVVVTGPAGAGKSTIGALVAERMGARFVEGDAFHPRENIERMASGEPLGDDDRAPWLAALASAIDAWLARDEDVVLACSALKEAYRRALSRDPDRVRFVYLRVPADVLDARLRARRGHYMRAGMLASQLADLEPPDDALVVDGAEAPDHIVERVAAALGRDS